MTCRTTYQADSDIINIYAEGVRSFGQKQAELYHAGLVRCLEILEGNPFIACERPDFTPPVRLYFYEAHVIVYTIDKKDVLVIRVLHGRQDWERHLG